MAKKRRRVRRVVKRTSRRLKRRSFGLKFKDNKIRLVIKNLVVFLALAIVSYLLSKVLVNDTLTRLLAFLSIVFVLLSVAFLIILLVFLILKAIKKK